jgi:hypothetical protein
MYLGDPASFERDLGRYRAVTAESLQQILRRTVATRRRVTLSVVPHGRRDLAAPGSEPVVVA